MPEPIEIDFEWANIPIFKINKTIARRIGRKNRKANFISLTMFFVVIFSAAVLIGTFAPDHITHAFPMAAFMAAALFLLVSWLQKRRSKTYLRSISQVQYRQGITLLTLSDAGITTTHPLMTVRFDWANLIDLIILENTTLLMLSDYEFLPLDHTRLQSITVEELHGAIAQWRQSAAQNAPAP